MYAEDGIRDWSVTGVQTCALPISRHCLRTRDEQSLQRSFSLHGKIIPYLITRYLWHDYLCQKTAKKHTQTANPPPLAPNARRPSRNRSEERRVGKEYRDRCTQKTAYEIGQ